MKRETRVERITRYETMLHEVTEVLRKAEQVIDEYKAVCPKIKALEKYYTSPTWKRDFKASEEGKLPEDLLCGVLSEDGINDVLDEDLALREELKGVCGETVVAYAEGNVGAEYARSAKLGGYFTPKNEE